MLEQLKVALIDLFWSITEFLDSENLILFVSKYHIAIGALFLFLAVRVFWSVLGIRIEVFPLVRWFQSRGRKMEEHSSEPKLTPWYVYLAYLVTGFVFLGLAWLFASNTIAEFIH